MLVILLFWFFNFFCDECNADPAIVSPKTIVKCQRYAARIRCCTFKASAKILRISEAQLINSAQYHDYTRDYFSNATKIIDRYEKFDTSQIDIGYNNYKEKSGEIISIEMLMVFVFCSFWNLT